LVPPTTECYAWKPVASFDQGVVNFSTMLAMSWMTMREDAFQ
jgi:hypothetical protein